MQEIEEHPLEPFLPKNAKLLMLGSFPPQETRWSMNFFYPNFQNDMWRIIGTIFFGNKDYFVIKEERRFSENLIKKFCEEAGIAIFDTALSVKRLKGNASDKFLEIIKPTNVSELLERMPNCNAIVTTGEKATDTLAEILSCEKPKIGTYCITICCDREIRFYRMPSSSRAYPMALDKKSLIYKEMFSQIEMI